MSTAKRVIKNSAVMMGSHIYAVIIALVTTGLIARYLGVNKFGNYGYVLAICTIFMVITDMGINRISIREMARDLSRANEFLVASLMLRIILSVITFTCIAVVVNLLSSSKEVITASYICALAVIIFFFGDVFPAVFAAFEKMEFRALTSLVEQTTYLIFILLCIGLDWGLNGIFIGLLLSYVARFLFGFWVTSTKFFKIDFKISGRVCRYLLKEGYPLGVGRIFRKLSFRVDTILIKHLRSSHEVGIYHGAYRLIIVLMFIPRNIASALFPVFSRLSKVDKAAVHDAYNKSAKFLLILALPLMTVLVIFAQEIIQIILGKQYGSAVPALIGLSFVCGLMFFSHLFTGLLNACDLQRLTTVSIAGCLVTNVILDLILIPQQGYMGGVKATLMAELILMLVSYYFVTRYVSSLSLRIMLKPILAAMPMVMLMYILKEINIFISIPVGMISYTVALVGLKTFDAEEMAIIRPKFFPKALGFSKSTE